MYVKKSVFISLLVACGLFFGAVGLTASNGLQKIQATLNHNIVFIADGQKWQPKDAKGKELSALVYDGSTYAPVRAIVELMGGEIDWDGDKQIITIDSNSGIPYLDSKETKETKVDNGKKNNEGKGSDDGKKSTDSGKDKESGTTAKSSMMTLPANFDVNKISSSKLPQEALKLIKMYGEALEKKDANYFDHYLFDIIAPENYNKSYTSGPVYSKEKMRNRISSSLENNDASIVKKYAATLKGVTLGQLELSNASNLDTLISVSYAYYPEGWDAFSSLYVYFTFYKTADGDFVLNEVRIS